ncbi:TPA: nucleotide exchange factor GrpE [Staphylococcus aureus]|uniref:Protein GrpE n=1 Tax=Staphylococcus aureus (strain bovine RF122 / ET3-1) TaxID=273036 RepID=GRPE_STAAB|nr:nucleotide exchange factor GrpE [Staphylococcus aureus]Q2YT46.1 RecName: Full=Protein GrpE; AltName: Full=HSP-70 cofactor [Staphylococcus aureus RF122]MBI0977537.1 nucleotide exchange factor GrpE [Staphylococcus aureus]MBU9753319.1 nucleotide exchange factor GrpE [Staphylococcus aureus]MBU9758285.1 nucleotide exchange factor GrpE [Staphylococcus aureus]MBU9779163.1 nucleotide exchange factor GrpE [Staphylococcus aureus]MBU9783941.1 nucleotide exchange factor GrpE [Staphylococcus aureus]
MTNKDESVEKNTESTVEVTNVKQNIDDSVEQTEESKGHLQDEAIEETSDENVIEEIDPKDQKINELQQLADENEEKYLRLYAEFENYKRRIQKENEINKTYQAQRVLTDILPAIDNIERALQIEGDDETFKSLQKGVQMVHESLINALKDNGLEVIKTEGEAFDPNIHQAVVQDDNPDFESGEITQELQKGYKLKDRVLRPSMVKVNQ